MPNLLSYSRIVLAGVFLFLISQAQIATAVFVVIVAAVTDFLDGYLARKINKTSSLGAVLDPIADRILVLSLCIGVFVKFWQPFFRNIAFLLIVRETLIVFGFYWLKSKKIKLNVTMLGKVSTAFIFTSFVLTFVVPKLGIYLLTVAMVLYFISVMDYGKRAWREIAKKT